MTDVLENPKLRGGITRESAPLPALSDHLITGDRYYTREFMQREWDGLWTKVWLIAGLINEVPEAGDYITYLIGRESIICTRGTDGRIRAFYNVCQHRGNRLITAERGSLNGGEFQCPYHGWRFSDQGECTWVY